METPSMQREGKSAIKFGFAQPIRAVLQFFLPVTVFIIILSYPHWPPCPLVKNLSHPLFYSFPALLDRKFMFFLCNVIFIFLSGAFLCPGDHKSPWKKILDVYDEYIMKKHWFSMTQERNIVDRPKSPAIEIGFQRTSADVKEKERGGFRKGKRSKSSCRRRRRTIVPRWAWEGRGGRAFHRRGQKVR